MRQVTLIPDKAGGYTVEEALTNIREAIELYIESLIEDGEKVSA